jgi:NADH-quinone oxidoreductase subunit A
MLSDFLPILVLFTVAGGLVLIMVVLSFVMGPKNPSAAKLAPYESGMKDLSPIPPRFPVKFLRAAMLFLIFDVETIAFFPWALLLRQLRWFAIIEMATFILVLGIGYVYVWRKGGFNID